MTTGPANDLEIAVIGMACRFPGADTIEAFWQNLRAGVESVTFFSDEELRESGVSQAVLDNPAYVKAAAVLRDIDLFDARFFGYTAREAQVLDPQHRLFLETCWEALERAGYDPERYRGSIGVFGGVGLSSWLMAVFSNLRLRAAVSPYQMVLSTDKDFLSTRVAYKLDLRGPAVAIQTACSTSLVAVHMACQSLLAGECEMALAGGVAISVPQATGYLHQPGGIASADGHCRAFDAAASGTIRGTGAGLVVLKRLADALRDRDQIEAVIRGSAINNDGGRKVGFTAPGVEGQAAVIRAAQATAGVTPEDITYVEAHGTATRLGDPIEIGALTEAFRGGTERRGYCAIGSVKTNIGHLDAAAGVAGLIKAVLMLKHREIVPSLHFERPNPAIDFAGSPFVVATRNEPWTSRGPRRAGVSSFGIGGTNAHVVLEEAPEGAPATASDRPEALLLSARTAAALERATDNLVEHLRGNPGLPLQEVAFTLRSGRRAFAHRRAVFCANLAQGAGLLARRDPHKVWTGIVKEGRPVAFLFSGQGAQHVGMGRGLYESEPAFRTEVDYCCARLEPALGLDLRSLLYPTPSEADAAGQRLNETCFTQPALFTIEYALARLWMSRGVVPAFMIGHSVGEYVAACLAGVLEIDEALAVVAERARLMQECPRGAMTAVPLAPEALRPHLNGRLDLCVLNGPEACVVGGPADDIGRLEDHLTAADVAYQRVATSHAFHSSLMEPALPAFSERLTRAKLRPPRIPFVSNLTGSWITAEQATDPAYWVRQLRETVRFADGLGTLLAAPGGVALEVGPGQTLTALARRRLPAGSTGLVLPSMRHPRQEEADEDVLLQTAARLWCAGVSIDVAPRDRGTSPRRVTLPTYPFERERYWIDREPQPEDAPPIDVAEPMGKQELDRWFHVPTWKRAESLAPPTGTPGRVCVFADDSSIAEAVLEALESAGAAVTVVRPGAAFAWTAAGEAVIAPGRAADYERLVDELAARGDVPERIIHLWGAAAAGESLDRGLLSVLFLGRAQGRGRAGETSLLVVTTGVFDVLGDETLSPLRAAVLGPCRVIPQEYPHVRSRVLDLPTAIPADGPEWLAQAVLAEASSGSIEPMVAYRGRSRWVPVYERIVPGAEDAGPAAAPVPLRPRGVYLVTGGLGKVGLCLAGYLARTVKARLVLTGRTGLPDPDSWNERLARASPGDLEAGRIRAVRALEASGAEVLVVKADVADPSAMRAALDHARARFGRLDGAIHAAGDVGLDALGPLDRMTREDCERQLRPKLAGAQVLANLLGGDPIDFVMLTSSVSTVLGGLGLGAYAAANCALDAFACGQHRAGRRAWTSVAWDGWSFDPAGGDGHLPGVAIEPSEGEEAFARILALGSRPQVVVSTTPLEGRLARWTRPAGEAARESSEDAQRELHERPEIGAVYVPPEDPVERSLAVLWGELLGIDRVGVDDNFFELGGSSLLAVHLTGRIRKDYPVALSVASLFEAPTVRALAAVIRSRRGPDPGLSRSADRGQQRRQNRKHPSGRSDAAVE